MIMNNTYFNRLHFTRLARPLATLVQISLFQILQFASQIRSVWYQIVQSSSVALETGQTSGVNYVLTGQTLT